ncbi:heterokaryon incompatibility protein-domain-containing protein [Xylariaceae sp. FL1272]|nr:heterokaryon incompatibility protein-domain-containing protein [Xylariaceae sp. FL1272]
MHLLKTDTIKLIPQNLTKPYTYAIFSHTWGDDEVVFEDFEKGHPEMKPSYKKVQSACREALRNGYDYIWIDNCCIDKRSSAELSEAINSMYAWYDKADVCYAYLSDVNATEEINIDSPDLQRHLQESRWFTRGWTLQELLASRDMYFYGKDWTFISTKWHLRGHLSSITGVDVDILEDPRMLRRASIAKRMSWAATRETTRPEDIAYCLMGVFRVNMPMLYGEGGVKAFWRLQEEIMKQSDDQSLFAWTESGTPDVAKHGLLADHPSAFINCRHIMPYEDYKPRLPFHMTNRGLSIELHLSRISEEVWVAALDCPVPPDYPDFKFLAIYLERLSVATGQFARIRASRLAQLSDLGALQTIYVRQAPEDSIDDRRPFPRHVLQFRSMPDRARYGLTAVVTAPELKNAFVPPPLTTSRVDPKSGQLPDRTTFSIARVPYQLTAGIIFEHLTSGQEIVVMLGSLRDFRIGYAAAELAIFKQDQGRFEVFSLRFAQNVRDPEKYAAIELREFEVRVGVDAVVSDASKYYMVDIDVVSKAPEPDLLSWDDVIPDDARRGVMKVGQDWIWPKIKMGFGRK